MTILLSNCFLLFHVMIAFGFAFILSFCHYVCGCNIHLKILHIIHPVLHFFWKSISFRSRASSSQIFSATNVTFPGHTEIFCNLAVKIPFNGSTSMTPSSSFLNKVLVRKMLLIQNFLINYLIPFFPIIQSL